MFCFQDQMHQLLRDEIKQEPGHNNKTLEWFQMFQKEKKCCGVEHHTDYQAIPRSCCKPIVQHCDRDGIKQDSDAFDQGCWSKMEPILALTAFGIYGCSSLLVIVTVLACHLGCRIRSKDDDDFSNMSFELQPFVGPGSSTNY